ncbi:hypothetical protein ACEPWQ_13125 [Leclercia adecarboxylata]|uniref:hypothetical protein n=1 Tax=Leclercia adecarboxylata TaxID=83655 RepID=UPI0030D4F610
MNYVNAAIEDMDAYRTKRVKVATEVTALEKQIEQLKATVVKPDMSKHIEAVTAELTAKKEAFLPALKKAVMTDEFTSQWQMRAISAFGQTKNVQTPGDLFRIDGGAATMAYMLTGQLDNKVLKIIMPHNDVFNYVHVLESMCKQLGILNEELEDIALDIEFLGTLKNFEV